MNCERLLEIHQNAQVYTPRITLRAVLPHKHAGAIIGIKGSAVKQIEKQHFVKINVAPIIGRLVNISGSANNVAQAWRTCLSFLSNAYPEYYQQNICINFLLTNDLVSLLKDQLEVNLSFEYMARSTNTQINLKHGTLPRSTERIVQVVIEDMDQLVQFEQVVSLLTEVTRIHTHLSMSPETAYYIPAGQSDDRFISTMKDEAIYK